MSGLHPANLRRRISDLQDAFRLAGDRAGWQDCRTSLADCRIYEAASIGIPLELVDPSTGAWRVSADVCRGCWQLVEGPVVVISVNAECWHYHPGCWPSYDEQLWTGSHGRPACRSDIPRYEGAQ